MVLLDVLERSLVMLSSEVISFDEDDWSNSLSFPSSFEAGKVEASVAPIRVSVPLDASILFLT